MKEKAPQSPDDAQALFRSYLQRASSLAQSLKELDNLDQQIIDTNPLASEAISKRLAQGRVKGLPEVLNHFRDPENVKKRRLILRLHQAFLRKAIELERTWGPFKLLDG